MHRLLRYKPSSAMVVACVALIVALGGTSVAAVSALAPGSVGPVQLKAGAVTNPKLRNKQGQYLVTSQEGRVLKRGHELENVLRVLELAVVK